LDGNECVLIASLIALTLLFAIELSQADKVLHHFLLWVCLIALARGIVGMDFFTDLPKSFKYNFTAFLIYGLLLDENGSF